MADWRLRTASARHHLARQAVGLQHAVLKELSEGALIVRASALLGDARMMVNQLALEHANESAPDQ